METKELKFKRDTQLRKQSFVPDSFAHPAKMDAQLLIWLIENYTKPGETVLDPMAGSGTMMLACGLGRHCILGELEGKFIKMCSDNLEKVRMMPQLGYQMGGCQIIQGDARQLTSLYSTLQQNDAIITSPPFQEPDVRRKGMAKSREGYDYGSKLKMSSEHPDNISRLAETNYGQIDKIVTSPPFGEAQSGGGIAKKGYRGDKHSPTDLVGKRSYMPENIGDTKGQIGNLPYGQIDKIVTSPPHGDSISRQGGESKIENIGISCRKARVYDDNPDNLGNLPYGNIDSIITSPPYEGALTSSSQHGNTGIAADNPKLADTGRYKAENENNIGNLKDNTYLAAMLQVYQQCHKVLKPSGLMILVTKNFIRDKQVIRLDLDTIKLCEQAGFILLERLYRKLPAQSFWRVIYHQKYPEVETIDYEDILVFRKDRL